MAYGAARRKEHQRLEWLKMCALTANPPFAAMVGLGNGIEVATVASGLRRNCREHKLQAAHRLWCFHWGDGYLATREFLEMCNSESGGVPEKRAARLREHRKPPRRPLESYAPVPVLHMCAFSCADDNARTQWRADINALVADGAESLGLLVHMGIGERADIAGDFDTLLPLMGDTTTVVMLHTERRGARGVLDNLRTDGWDAVELAGVAIAQRRPLPRSE